MVIRKLVSINGFIHTSLRYNNHGKPFLTSGPRISISHTNQYVVMVVSYGPKIGVDIELERPKILRGEKYFCNTDKSFRTYSSEEKIKKLTKIWCAKEAIFKAIEVEDVSYKYDIVLQEFDLNSKETSAVFRKKNFHIEFDSLNHHQVAIATEI